MKKITRYAFIFQKPLVVIAVFCIYLGWGQTNLVFNSGFESYTLCPDYTTDYTTIPIHGNEIARCLGWTHPTQGTSDYFNTCAVGTIVDIPQNAFGYQVPKNGNGYTGFYGYLTNDYCEYIQGQLTQTLLPNTTYSIAFYINLSDSSGVGINNIGAWFSTTSTTQTSAIALQNTIPQILTTNVIKDTLNWSLITGTFVANGGEKYITIGRFYNNNLLDTIILNSNPNYGYSYYYVDAIALQEVSTDINYSVEVFQKFNILTPNKDGVNDCIDFKKYGFVELIFEVFNRWGETVYTTTDINAQWQGTTNNNTPLPCGTYYYLIKAIDKNKNILDLHNYLTIVY